MTRRSAPIRLQGTGRLDDRLVAVACWLTAAAVLALFFWLVGDVLRYGASGISWEFLTSAPLAGGREGGIGPMIVATLLILLVAMVVAVPLGTATAVLLAEFTRQNSWYSVVIRRCLDVVAAVPSIVFGLFGNALFCNWLGLGYSILSGGLTLACMVLPILIRSLETALRLVPLDYRRAAAALGISKTSTVTAILLPQAVPGLVVGLILGIGRVLAETAALLFTSGYVMRMPTSLLDSGRSLSIHIYDLSMNVPGGDQRAYATTLVLVVMLLTINGTAIWLADRWLSHRTASSQKGRMP